jgi:hypothetical protein
MQLAGDPKQKHKILAGSDCVIASADVERSVAALASSLVEVERGE